MKLIFEGETLAEIHAQIGQAAAELFKGPVNTEVASHIDEPVKQTEKDTTSAGTTQRLSPPESAINAHFAAAALPTVVGELDSRGVPWDARIHAGTKTKLDTGAWRYKRGVQDPEIEAVEAQIAPHATKAKKVSPFGGMSETQYQAHVAPQAPVAPPMPTTNNVVHMPPAVHQSAPVQAPPVVAEPVPVPQAAPANNVYSRDSFRKQLPMALASLVQQGKIDRNYIMALEQHFKVKTLAEVASNERDCNVLFDQFVNYGFITGV